jgi:hypothetical protein
VEWRCVQSEQGVRAQREGRFQKEQHTGMPFMHMQQVQPALHIAIMQSQQAWIIEQQAGSPLVQVMQTPFSIMSHLHMPIIMLQQQTIMPFIIMQQLHMPPAIIVQRFCIMAAVVLSSEVHMIFIPPVHFSIFMVQRGTIIICGAIGMVGTVAIPPIVPVIIGLIPVIMPDRSIIIAVVIALPPDVKLEMRGILHTASPTNLSLCEPEARMQFFSFFKIIKICR